VSSADPEIRSLTPGDREAVRQLHEASFADEVAFDDIVLDRVFRHGNALNLVAKTEDGIVGFAAALHGSRPKARLLTIQTHPEARGRGVASALLAEVQRRLRARKADVLELEVHVDNEPAIELYEKRGFAIEREDPAAYPSLDTSAGYIMHKQL